MSRVTEQFYRNCEVQYDADNAWLNIQAVVRESFDRVFAEQQTLSDRLTALAARLSAVESTVQGLQRDVSERLTRVEFYDAQEKALSAKCNIVDVNEVLRLHKRDFRTRIEELSSAFVETQKQIVLKANIKDVMTLIRQRLSKKCFVRYVKEQNQVNSVVSTEHCLGRWVWNNQALKNGRGIAWNVQVVNTDEENFLFRQQHVHIVIANAGLYRLSFSFFNFHNPVTVQLHIDGIVALTKEFRHQFFNSYESFVVFKDRSKVAMAIRMDDSETTVEGFLSIQKQ